jgi:hypothetical protein
MSTAIIVAIVALVAAIVGASISAGRPPGIPSSALAGAGSAGADRLEPRASTKSPKSPRRHPLDGSAAPAFVELLAASTGTATSCVVEVESAHGGKLRLELKAIGTSELAELMRTFAAS